MSPSRSLRILSIVTILTLASCGRDKFVQEFDLETTAVALAREMRSGDYSLITTRELYDRVQDETSNHLLIDAMPAENFAKEHIAGAINFVFPKEAMNTWDAELTNGKTEEDYAALLGPDKSRPIYVYCGYVKCLRSHNAAMWARRLGYTTVLRHPGGIFAWKGAKRPLVASTKQ